MPKDLQDLLDYEGKIDRGSENIGRLIEEGEKAATGFLEERAAAVPPRRWARIKLPDRRSALPLRGQASVRMPDRRSVLPALPPSRRPNVKLPGRPSAPSPLLLRHRARIRLTVRPNAATDAASPPGERQADGRTKS